MKAYDSTKPTAELKNSDNVYSREIKYISVVLFWWPSIHRYRKHCI